MVGLREESRVYNDRLIYGVGSHLLLSFMWTGTLDNYYESEIKITHMLKVPNKL